jgi:hypothetical protein
MVGRWKGQFPVFFDKTESDQDVSDFHDVPASDLGDQYGDAGQLGGFETNDGKPWPQPADVVFFDGYGATQEDLKRGFCDPGMREDPAYDKENYADRSSRPKRVDENVGNTGWLPKDIEFQSRNTRSKGFLTRKRLPTER